MIGGMLNPSVKVNPIRDMILSDYFFRKEPVKGTREELLAYSFAVLLLLPAIVSLGSLFLAC
jgi:hypothetical protein